MGSRAARRLRSAACHAAAYCSFQLRSGSRGGRASGSGDSNRGNRGRTAGCFVPPSLLPSRTLKKHIWNRLLRVDAHGIATAAVQWLRDKLGIIKTAGESGELAASVPDTGGVYFVPAFVGLGAPHWDSQARGTLSGLTAASGRAQIARAALEAIAYQTRELVEAMEADSGEQLKELRVDGGAAASDFLMQFQADILGKRIVRPADAETTALGAAYLAGLATGFFKSLDELEQFWQADKVYEPAMPAQRREDLYRGWKAAVARCQYRLP